MSDDLTRREGALPTDDQHTVLAQTHAVVTQIDHALAVPTEVRSREVDRAEQLLAQLRDTLIELTREPSAWSAAIVPDLLRRANTALSLLIGVEYPSGGKPVESLQQARAQLVEIEEELLPTPRQQLFRPSANTVAKVSIVGGVLTVGLLLFLWGVYVRSPWYIGTTVTVDQPVPFSHQHHVGVLGIDCRMCHTSVEQSASAGMPPTQTCMTCHSQIWADSPMLAPVHESFRTGVPIAWNRVYELPGYVYFNHSIHVQKGIGCVSCHGQIDQMRLTAKATPLTMQWCLDCHRAPEKYIRPRDQVFNTSWVVPDQLPLGRKLVDDYHIMAGGRLTNCSICHR